MSGPHNLHMGVADQSNHNEYSLSGNAMLSQHYGALYNNIIHTPHANRPTIPRCPAPSPNYTPREAIENHIRSYFLARCLGMKRYVLHGLGGTGKTEIGLNLVDTFCYSEEPDKRLFREAWWVDATTDDTIKESFKDIGLSIGVGPEPKDVLRWLASRNANWIVVFNNADDPNLDLTKYFPKCAHGNILITTRNYHARCYGVGPGSDYEVSEMTAEEALTLFKKHVRLFESANPALIETAKILVEEVGRFALAVIQAGAFISQCGLSRYNVLDRDQRQELLRQYEKMPITDHYKYQSLYATWMISYVRLSEPARELFQVFGCVHHEGIEEEMFSIAYSGGVDQLESGTEALLMESEKAGLAKLKKLGESLSTDGKWDFMKFRGLVWELQSYSLVVFNPERGTCTIHPLVHKWVRNVCDGDQQPALRQCAILLLGSSLVKFGTTKELAFCRALVCHIDQIFQGIEPHANTCGDRFGMVYWKVGRRDDAVVHQELFRELCRGVLGEDHPTTLASTNDLASTYSKLGRSNDAEKLQSRVVEARKRILGPEHPDTLASMINLAFTYSKLGRFNGAKKLQSRVLEAQKRISGPEHPDTLAAMCGLASIYSKLGRFNDAETLQSQLVERQKRILGPEHLDTLTSMSNLASTYSKLGWFNDAEKLWLQVVEGRKRVLGPEHPNTLTAMCSLASIYSKLGRFNDAKNIQSQVLEAHKRILGPEHPDTFTAIYSFALTYSELGRFNEAEKLQLQVVEGRKRVLRPEHPDTLRAMYSLAYTYSKLGRFSDAEKLWSQVVEGRKRASGPEHPDTLRAMYSLALTYSNQGRLNDAEKLQSRVLEGHKMISGSKHLDTLTAMYSLAFTYSKLGRSNDAEKLWSQVVEGRKKVLGPEHPDTLTAMCSLASTYSKLGRSNDAEKLQSQIVEGQKRVLGPEHPDTLTSAYNLACIYRNQGKSAEAEELARQTLTRSQRVLGADHLDTKQINELLSDVKRRRFIHFIFYPLRSCFP